MNYRIEKLTILILFYLLIYSSSFSQTRQYIPNNPFELYLQKRTPQSLLLLGYEEQIDSTWHVVEWNRKYFSCQKAIDSSKSQPLSIEISFYKPFGDSLPDSIFQIQNLQFLRFNHAGWRMPENYGWKNFTNLRGISINDFYHNEDSMTLIPASLFEVPKLAYMEVKTSDIELNNSIRNAKRLEYLAIRESDPKVLPNELFQLRSLRHLMFKELAIEIPAEIHNLKRLQTLILDRVPVNGLYPGLAQLRDLKYLFINDPSLDTFPSSLKHLKKLESLIVYSRSMAIFPEEIRSLKHLRMLRVIAPCENFPDWLPELKKLTQLELITNTPGFTKWMSMIGQIRSLEKLEFAPVNNTQEDDTASVYLIPDSFSNLKRLKIVRFNSPRSKNPFQAPEMKKLAIPASFSQLSNLGDFTTMIPLSDLYSLENLCKVRSLKKISLIDIHPRSAEQGLSVDVVKEYVEKNRPDLELYVNDW